MVFDIGTGTEILRGHLRDPRDRSVRMHRYEPPPAARPWIRVFGIPVWNVPAGEVREQRVLTYPVCLLSISAGYARLLGPRTTAARMPLADAGWTFGVMLAPSAGRALLGQDVAILTDRHRDLEDVPLLADLVPAVRALMAANPNSPDAHRAACRLTAGRLTALPAPDAGAALVDRLVERVEQDAGISGVAQLCAVFGLRERTLQRLCARFLGVSPRWLIRRRRLQEAGLLLRGGGSLGGLAVRLGYADQAHFSRDFRAATGWSPGEFAAMVRRDGGPGDG